MANDIGEIASAINRELPKTARAVIEAYLDLADPANRSFVQQPDAREQHQTRWHQWGIITHTRMFLRHFDTDIPCYLRQWGLWPAVSEALGERIDGVARWDLLRIAILLHDIGKFGARTQGRYRFHFTHHERLSGQIIRAHLDLARFGLTPAQVEYIAVTAEDHFVLGLLRKELREEGTYDPAFAEGPAFRTICLQIKQDHGEDFVEIGVLFLGDSLAKSNRGEGPADALSQYDVNIEVARRYLEIVLQPVV